MSESGRLMIIEAEASAARDLRRTLEAGGFTVSGHATTGAEAIDKAQRLVPDLILMDVLLGNGTDGTATARAIRELVDVPILYMSARSDDRTIRDAIRSGAVGYIVKPVDARQVTAAVTVALAMRTNGRMHGPGERGTPATSRTGNERGRCPAAVSMSSQTRPARINRNTRGQDRASSDRADRLVTPRERELVICLVGHRRLSVVAEVLGISVHTARNHLKSVFRKLHLHSQDELLRYLRIGDE